MIKILFFNLSSVNMLRWPFQKDKPLEAGDIDASLQEDNKTAAFDDVKILDK